MQRPKERIPKSKGWLMIGTAGLLDLIGIIPVVAWVPDLAHIMLFPFWFHTLGAPYNKSMWSWQVTSFIIGLIPIVGNILPEMTICVIRNVRHIQKEDRQKIQEWQKAQAAEAAAEAQAMRMRQAQYAERKA